MADAAPALPPVPDHDDDHDRGLVHDLGTVMARRRALRLLGGAGLGLALAACGASGSSTTSAEGSTTTSTSTSTAAAGGDPGDDGASGGSSSPSGRGAIPEETAGPYPGDGSNGPDVLLESGIVRRDITSSFGSSSGTAEGVPLALTLAVTDASSGDPLPGAAVYVWHCDRDGGYSMYSQGVEDQNYLRGVQEAGADGTVTFDTIVPAAYSGRWPHIHLEVYPSLDEATSSGTTSATSQVALPADVCDAVYATDGYEQSVTNLARTSLQSDMVFRDDGGVRQTPEVTGSVDAGYVATLTVPV